MAANAIARGAIIAGQVAKSLSSSFVSAQRLPSVAPLNLKVQNAGRLNMWEGFRAHAPLLWRPRRALMAGIIQTAPSIPFKALALGSVASVENKNAFLPQMLALHSLTTMMGLHGVKPVPKIVEQTRTVSIGPFSVQVEAQSPTVEISSAPIVAVSLDSSPVSVAAPATDKENGIEEDPILSLEPIDVEEEVEDDVIQSPVASPRKCQSDSDDDSPPGSPRSPLSPRSPISPRSPQHALPMQSNAGGMPDIFSMGAVLGDIAPPSQSEASSSVQSSVSAAQADAEKPKALKASGRYVQMLKMAATMQKKAAEARETVRKQQSQQAPVSPRAIAAPVAASTDDLLMVAHRKATLERFASSERPQVDLRRTSIVETEEDDASDAGAEPTLLKEQALKNRRPSSLLEQRAYPNIKSVSKQVLIVEPAGSLSLSEQLAIKARQSLSQKFTSRKLNRLKINGAS